MANNPAQLIDLAYKTYSQPLGDINTDSTTEYVKRERKREDEAMKSLYDIGADLDAAAYSTIQKEFNSIHDDIRSGKLNYRSPEFRKRMSKMRSTAYGAKQIQDDLQVGKDRIAEGEEITYIGKDAQGRPVNLGAEGFTRDIYGVSQGEYATNQDFIKSGSGVLGGVSKNTDENVVRKNVQAEVANELANVLRESGLDDEDIESVMIDWRNGVRDINTDISEEKREEIIDGISQRLGSNIEGVFANANGRGEIPDNITTEEWKRSYIDNMIPKRLKDRKDIIKPSQSSGSTATERKAQAKYNKEVEASKDVKADVNQAQKSNDPTTLNKYLRGAGFEVKVGDDGMWNMYEIGKTDKGDRIVSTVNPNESYEVYGLIATNNPNISEEAINSFEFEAAKGDETPAEREARNRAEKQEKTIDKVLDTLGDPSKKTISQKKQIEADASNLKVQKQQLDKIKGVSYTDEDGKSKDIDRIVFITVDGIKYDMREEDQATKANQAIKNQIRKNEGVGGLGIGSLNP